jgi:hypothetical protein
MMARGETATAENCLLSPKNETPAGSHWFYRIDHVNKHNCWYLRREGGEVAQALPETSPPAPAPAPVAKPSFVDARAELRPQAAIREDTAVANPPAATSNPANTAGNNASNSANAPVWNTAAAVATRWPESPPASSVPKAAPVVADTAGNASQPAAVAPAAAASVADLPASVPPEVIPTLIAAAIGALAFASAAALIFRRHRRRVRRRKATSARGPIWETTDDDRIVLSDFPAMDDRDFRPRFARGVASATSRHQRAPEVALRMPRRARR